ncbi:MAG: DUF2197 domain-containing protein [Candidatus Zambryskibacteria bacterium]|nr:DUF2197 domain-containing protein [Candidatus Zambryskibacteria bacterium]
MEIKCPKCNKSEKVQMESGNGRRLGNQWFETYVCGDCHHKFEQSEEIKMRGN